MKKTYISPSMEVIKVNVANIIAASTIDVDMSDGTAGEEATLGREDDAISSSNVWEQGW